MYVMECRQRAGYRKQIDSDLYYVQVSVDFSCQYCKYDDCLMCFKSIKKANTTLLKDRHVALLCNEAAATRTSQNLCIGCQLYEGW